jgi:hypothetical protein
MSGATRPGGLADEELLTGRSPPNARSKRARTGDGTPRCRGISGQAEILLAVAVSGLAAAALFGPHVAAGGRYLDDWWLGVYVRFPGPLGFANARDYLDFYSGARPVAVAYWLVTYKLFGFHDVWHRALGAALSAGLATVFYLLLRELRVRRADAAAIAALSLALPIADSIHFWITPDVAQLCLATAAAGLILALRSLRATGRRALALQAGACALYAASMLIAETMVPAIGLSVLIYLTRVDWRRAVRAWMPVAVLTGIAAIHYAVSAPPRRVAAAGDQTYLQHARTLADQALTLLAGTLVPFAHSRAWVLVGLLGLGGCVAWSLRGRGRLAVDPWVIAAGLAAIFAAASYLIYVPSDPSYEPLVAGIGNRINIGALMPVCVLAFAVARLIGGLAARRRRAPAAVTAVLWLVVLIGGVARLEGDRKLWDQAADQQTTVIAALHEVLPRPPENSAILVFDAPGVVTHFERVGVAWVNEPVPVFSTWWELDAAVELSYGRTDLDAYPVWSYQPPQVACGAHDVYQLGLDGVRHVLAYGHVYVVDVTAPSAIRVDDPTECARIVSQGTTVRYDLPV